MRLSKYKSDACPDIRHPPQPMGEVRVRQAL